MKKEIYMPTTKQLQDIEQLQKECEEHDGIQLKLNWDMLRKRENDQLDFFCYNKNELVAFLGLYPFGSTVEVCGMVKPTERRNHHFNHLFQRGMDTVKENGYKKILLNAPAGSKEAKAFLAHVGATYAFSEHQMTWREKDLKTVDGFTLRHATEADLAMRVRLDAECFGIPEEDAKVTESRIDGEADTDMWMIDVDEETIGKIRVKRKDGKAWIYGFSILPSYQGKGIGRKVLQLIIMEQHSSGYSVHLEVETKNSNALRLYESLGFEVVHAQDYYTYSR